MMKTSAAAIAKTVLARAKVDGGRVERPRGLRVLALHADDVDDALHALERLLDLL